MRSKRKEEEENANVNAIKKSHRSKGRQTR